MKMLGAFTSASTSDSSVLLQPIATAAVRGREHLRSSQTTQPREPTHRSDPIRTSAPTPA
jgi:hypothetical protein